MEIKKSIHQTNIFVDRIMKNAHMEKNSKIYFDNHRITLPYNNLTIKQISDREVGEVIEIYYDGILKALIRVDKIIGVMTEE